MTMKQYTTPEQTAKLIELGVEKPKTVLGVGTKEEAGDLELGYICAYSIGELIEMLPLNRIEFDLRAYVDTTGGLFYDHELIDALFKACVKLKEEGVI